MKKVISYLLLLMAGAGPGCLELPTSWEGKKEPPPPVTAAPPRPQRVPPPVTADQVTDENSWQMADALSQELTRENDAGLPKELALDGGARDPRASGRVAQAPSLKPASR